MNIFTQDATLDDLLTIARAKFTVAFEPITIDGRKLEILQIADMSAYLDQLAANAQQKQLVLPFWAKLWPASTLLSYFVQRLPAPEGKTLLEIGAGLGLVGLFAAAVGFDATISDLSEDSLLFCRINILKNGLAERARVRKVDFTSDRLEQTFDYILGCEVLYREDDYRPLSKFLLRHLKTDSEAEAILSTDYTREAKKFFQYVEKEFLVQKKLIGYAAGKDNPDAKERCLCAIYRLKPRKHQ